LGVPDTHVSFVETGLKRELHELAPLAASLDVEDGADRRYLLRLLNLSLLTSQVRIIGFGSDGTLRLTTDAGTYSVNVADALVVDFRGLLSLDEPPPPADMTTD
jgi:hypothetical protein